MNQDEDLNNDDTLHAGVSALYKELANESVPTRLDRSVLRKAAASKGKAAYLFNGWLRPATFVATVGLCLAILVQVRNETPREPAIFDIPAQDVLPAPAAGGSDRARPSAGVDDSYDSATGTTAVPSAGQAANAQNEPADAGRSAGSTMNVSPDGDSAASPINSEHAVPSAGQTANVENEPADTQSSADASKSVLAEAESANLPIASGLAVAQPAAQADPEPVDLPAVESSNQSMATDFNRGASLQTQAPAAAMESVAGLSAARSDLEPAGRSESDEAERFCTDEQIGTAEAWWQCIQMLEEAEQNHAASIEAELLKAAFPEFSPAR